MGQKLIKLTKQQKREIEAFQALKEIEAIYWFFEEGAANIVWAKIYTLPNGQDYLILPEGMSVTKVG